MNNCYLDPIGGGSSQRGAIFVDGEPILEIGSSSNCSPGMLAFAAHKDGIMEFLRTTESPLSEVILASIQNETDRLGDKLEAKRIEQQEIDDDETNQIIGVMRESDIGFADDDPIQEGVN